MTGVRYIKSTAKIMCAYSLKKTNNAVKALFNGV